MHVRWPLAISAVIGLAGCPKHEAANADRPVQTGAGDAMSNAGDGWDQAMAIARKSGAAGVARWKDDIPYLFQAKGSRGVLVHKGAVYTARGPAAAGAYLREVGVLEGKGPSPDSLLTVLYVLKAFPEVANLPEQSAVDTLGPPDLQPRVEVVNGHAHVILNYFLPDDNRGAQQVPSRQVMRETLDIPPTGDAAWSGTQVEWKLP